MADRRFGLKGAVAGAISGLFAAGTGLTASAQSEAYHDEDNNPVAVSGDTTVTVTEDGPVIAPAEDEDGAEDDAGAVTATAGEDEAAAEVDDVDAAEDAAEDDGGDAAADDGGTATEVDLSESPSVSISDASGGDENFAFAS